MAKLAEDVVGLFGFTEDFVFSICLEAVGAVTEWGATRATRGGALGGACLVADVEVGRTFAAAKVAAMLVLEGLSNLDVRP